MYLSPFWLLGSFFNQSLILAGYFLVNLYKNCELPVWAKVSTGNILLAASLLAWKVHSWCVFICEQQKWENVPVGGGSQNMNPFFF